MPRKKGLGQPSAPDTPEDLLDSVFGAPAPSPAQGTPAPASTEQKKQRVAKYFQLDRELVKKLKVYAAQNDLKEQEVIDKALRLLFSQAEG